MDKFKICNSLCIEFIDSVFSPISSENIHFEWLDKDIVLNNSEEFALAIILQNTYLFNTYISMPHIYSELQKLNLVRKTKTNDDHYTDLDSFSRSFRRRMDKYPELKDALIVQTQRGYKTKYEIKDTTNGRIDFINSICFSSTSLIAITGVGGSGKTYVANYIYNFYKKRSELQGKDKTVFKLIFNTSLEKTLLPLDIGNKFDNDEIRLHQIREHMMKHAELLYIDNVNFNSLTDKDISFLKGLKNSSIRVIFTTRVLPDRMRFIDAYEIPEISFKQAVDIFHYYYNYNVFNSTDEKTIEEIVKKAARNILVVELLAKTARLNIRRGMYLPDFLYFLNEEGFNFPNKDLINTDRWEDMSVAEQITKLYDINNNELNYFQKTAILDLALSQLIPLSQIDIRYMFGIPEKEIDVLYDNGWLSYADGNGFYMHDIIKTAVMLQYKSDNNNSILAYYNICIDQHTIRKFGSHKYYVRTYAPSKISVLYSCINLKKDDSIITSLLYEEIADLYLNVLGQTSNAIAALKESLHYLELNPCEMITYNEDHGSYVRYEDHKLSLLMRLSHLLSYENINELSQAMVYVTYSYNIILKKKFNRELYNYDPRNHQITEVLNNKQYKIDDTPIFYDYYGGYLELTNCIGELCNLILLSDKSRYNEANKLLKIAIDIVTTCRQEESKYSSNDQFMKSLHHRSRSSGSSNEKELHDFQDALGYLLVQIHSLSHKKTNKIILEAQSLLNEAVKQRAEYYVGSKNEYLESKKNPKSPLYFFLGDWELDGSECNMKEYYYHFDLRLYAQSIIHLAECKYIEDEYEDAFNQYVKALNLGLELMDSLSTQFCDFIPLCKYGMWCIVSKYPNGNFTENKVEHSDLINLYKKYYDMTNDELYLRDLEFIETVNQTKEFIIPKSNLKHFILNS